MMHTETPWRHRAVNGGWDGVVAETGEEICRLSYNNPSNADFIATACNAHEALVEAVDYDLLLLAATMLEERVGLSVRGIVMSLRGKAELERAALKKAGAL